MIDVVHVTRHYGMRPVTGHHGVVLWRPRATGPADGRGSPDGRDLRSRAVPGPGRPQVAAHAVDGAWPNRASGVRTPAPGRGRPGSE